MTHYDDDSLSRLPSSDSEPWYYTLFAVLAWLWALLAMVGIPLWVAASTAEVRLDGRLTLAQQNQKVVPLLIGGAGAFFAVLLLHCAALVFLDAARCLRAIRRRR